MRFFPSLALGLACAVLVAACTLPKPPSRRYYNQEYGFSFIPPKGWKVSVERTKSCLVSVTAQKGDCAMYVCVSRPPQDFLTTKSEFVNCEQVKQYVAETLKGFEVRCSPSFILGRRTYDAIYLRRVQKTGGVTLQLVRQSFLAHPPYLYTITTYVFGNDGEALRRAAQPCDEEILWSSASFFLQPTPAPGTR